MSKVTPSAIRGLSVAAGTVGLVAVGAAVAAGQASADSGLPGLGGGPPVSTNAVPVVVGAVAHNHGTIAGIPLSGLPAVGRLPGMVEGASPAADALPGLGHAGLGALPVGRSRPLPGATAGRAAHAARHAAPAHAAPAHAAPVHTAPVHTAPAPTGPAMPTFPPSLAPAPHAPAPATAPVPNAHTGPLDSVTNALHGLPIAGRLAGPGGSLPLVGGLAGGLPLAGLTGGLAGLGG